LPTKPYETKDGRKVTIKGDWDEDIVALNEAGREVGRFELHVKQSDHPPHDDYVWFSHAQVQEGWQMQGVATACIRFAKKTIYGDDIIINAPSILDTMKEHENMLSIEGAKLLARVRYLKYVSPDPAYKKENS